MKQLTLIFIMTCLTAAVKAQSLQTGTATQQVSVSLADVIDISLVNSNMLSLQFNSINDYANGVKSTDQVIKIRSNKRYNVRVRTSSSRFSYSGTTSPAPVMNVNPVLKVMVTSNSTGGSVTSGYNHFKTLSTSGSKIINNANPGNNSSFSVQYEATPGFTYPAGTYSVDVVYTATQA